MNSSRSISARTWLALAALAVLGLGGLALALSHKSPGELLRAAKNSSLAVFRVAPPSVKVETSASFEYEQWTQMLSLVPTSPNTWYIESKITNDSASAIEVLPLYLYSEAFPNKTVTWTNTSSICPKAYKHAYSEKQQELLTFAPEDLSGKIHSTIFLPIEQLDQPPDLSHGITFGGMISTRDYPVALNVDGKPALWAKLKLEPHSAAEAVWQFESIWAPPQKTRSDPAFEIVQLGPIIRAGAGAQAKAYVVVVRHTDASSAKGIKTEQASWHLQAVAPTLAQELSKAFPNNNSPVENYGNAALKLAAEP
jgi:hypothetical protein